MLLRFVCGVLLGLSACSSASPAQDTPPPTLRISPSSTFWQEQLRFERVRNARKVAGPRVAALLQRHYLNPEKLEIFLRHIKTDSTLEVWGRNQGAGPFELLKKYPLAAMSGTLGPKRQSGDYQVPEGFYHIDRFNPQSLFHMSLGLNYPNEADRALGEPNPGGDIFIHGSDVTIGCLPITDPCIRELYLLAVAARASGQLSIPVHIFPFPLTQKELARHPGPHQAFWRGLLPGYTYFEQHHELTPELLAGR
ncbi:hypothetical protein Q5H93_17760 [Hymenobacter sp. ASUV-10]|uniref:L,D-TPase catalytic domain-containing protein n=1 Tax=Hymenobacter aranciens TaxID=3063996 RepID=A0ABT9BIY0_9BACT|nr:hypothetical protein [Hymenobacter sp. ASUV-10]MDO7876596.1 hypothetical protein [Hymenobacter sp. ASUV-10]